jgi:hypothetical protein
LDAAIVHFQRALEANPGYARSYDALVASLGNFGNARPGPLKLDDAAQPAAQEEAFYNARHLEQKHEKLEAQSQQNLKAVIAYILTADGSAPRSVGIPQPGLPPQQSAAAGRQEMAGSPNHPLELDQTPSAHAVLERLVGSLEIPRLRKLAAAKPDSEESLASQRQILRIFLRTFEVGSALMVRDKCVQALWSFEIAARVAPTNPYISYDLARAQALNGAKREALKTLQAAVGKGFDDSVRLEGDLAFENMRAGADYQKLLARLRDDKPVPPL